MRFIRHLSNSIRETAASRRVARLLLALLLGSSFAGLVPAPALAQDVPIELVLGGSGATAWTLSNLRPGSSGNASVEIHNAGKKNGFVTIWLSDIINVDGDKSKNLTGTTPGQGQLGDHVLLNIDVEGRTTNMKLPAKINDFPQAYDSGLTVEVIPVKSGSTIQANWGWELPPDTGNEVQGDWVTFKINYHLREMQIDDVSGDVSDNGTFTDNVTVKSDDIKSTVTIDKNTVGTTKEDKPITELWLIKIDKEPPVQTKNEEVIGMWEAGPEGTKFEQPVTLTLAYRDPEDIPPNVKESDLVIGLWDEETGKWDPLPGCVVDMAKNVITAPITHFSRYAVTGKVIPPPPPGGGGGGGGGGAPPPPAQPVLPPVSVLPMITLDFDMLGHEGTVEISPYGNLAKPLTLKDDAGKFVIEMGSGTRISSTGDLLPNRIELREVDQRIMDAANIQIPKNMVQLSPVYRLTGYVNNVSVPAIYFDPSAILSISYDTKNLPQNILSPFIGYLTTENGIEPIKPPEGSLTEIGQARGEITHASLFVVAAELAPPAPPLPAEFKLSNLTINPQKSLVNEPVNISIDITNDGGSANSYEIYLQVDGIVKSIKKITVEPGTSQTVTFDVSGLAGGVHEVKIGNITGQFEVIRTMMIPTKPTVNWLSWDVGIGAAVFASLAVLYFILRRVRRPAPSKDDDKPASQG